MRGRETRAQRALLAFRKVMIKALLANEDVNLVELPRHAGSAGPLLTERAMALVPVSL